MEGMNYLTSGDLAMWEVRNRNYGYPCDGYGHHQKTGMAATGIGLGAGLGGAALIAAFVVGWGVNQASKARARAAENSVNLLNSNLNQLANLQISETQNRQAMVNAERISRETWQNYHAPTTTQYVDVRSGAFSGAGSNALAQAEAQIVSNALTGRMTTCPTPVALYSAPQPCGCPGSCNG